MSVEKNGQQGYEYQYLISLFFAIKKINNYKSQITDTYLSSSNNIEIFIECNTSEDAQINYVEDEQMKTIDIQVKKRSEPIKIKEYCKWISHFEERKSDSNLLSKLKNNQNNIVIFVTNQRCKDDVSLFLSKNDKIQKLNTPINKKKLKLIKSNILMSQEKDSSLSKKRREFLDCFLNETSTEELKNILRKMIIFTRYDYDDVKFKLERILNKEFYISQSNLDKLIPELINIIKKGRDDEKNIYIDILNKLKDFKENRIFNKNEKYFRRNEFSKCFNLLDEKDVLLLTGVSQCGKTYLAKNIAQKLQDKGYNIKITNDLLGHKGAKNFILKSVAEDRLCILEDPFGSLEMKERVLKIKTEIRALIKELCNNKKLIITSRKDILYKVFKAKTLDEVAFYNNQWIDLTINNKKTAKIIWRKYFGESKKSINLFYKIDQFLTTYEKGDFLQPGQIHHLYHEFYDNKKEIDEMFDNMLNLEVSKIVETARVDSEELAHKLSNKNKECKKLIITLGLGCNTINSMKIKDLSYLLGDFNEKPALKETAERYRKIEGTSKFPEYKFDYKLNDIYRKELEFLHQHQYININESNRSIVFTHPIYYHASKFLIKKELNGFFSSEEILRLIERSLGILNKNSVFNAIKVLEEIYLESKKDDVKELILKGLYSIFPAVRDRIVSFFNTRIEQLSEEEKSKFLDQLYFYKSMNNGLILWHKEEPWLNIFNERSNLLSPSTSETKSNIIQIKEKIINNDKVSSKEMWQLLNYDISLLEKEEKVVLNKALESKESFIRGKAIYEFFKNYAYNCEGIDDYLNCDEHPNVIYRLFEGAIQSWREYNDYKKNKIIKFVKKSFEKMTVVMRFKRILENFCNSYNNEMIKWSNCSNKEKEILWNIWYQLIIELMINFPSKYARLDQLHLDQTINESLNFINDKNKIVKLANAWLGWLNDYKEYRFPDNAGMSVVDYLLKGTENNSEVRKGIIKKIFTTENTSLLTVHIKYLIRHWSYLSTKEKEKIKGLFYTDRKDKVWIKALVITREKVPIDLQKELFGKEIMDDNLFQVLDENERKLLEYSLNIYCGYPQPLWWNGYHHCNSKIWDEIIKKTLKRKTDKSFEISLRELIGSLINNKEGRFKDGYLIWENINKNANKKARKKIFNRLLYDTINQNYANKKKLWKVFFKYCNEEEKNKYIKIIIEEIEGIQNHHHRLARLLEVFNQDFISKEILPRIPEDKLLLGLYIYIKRRLENDYELESHSKKIDFKEKIRLLLIKIYSKHPPRLFIINNLILNIVEKMGIKDGELKKIITENENRLLELSSEIAEEYNDYYELEDWIY